MKTKHFLLAASVLLAMLFTLSCSIDDIKDYVNDSSSSSGGGNPSSSSGGGQGGGGGGSSCPFSAVSNNSVTCGSQTYRTVQIGNQKWFAENLNYNVAGSKCYDDDPAYCTKYGRLYDWNTAKTVCPNGWHLPDTTEWRTLIDFAGGKYVAGTKLKATSEWDGNGNGTDDYGFSALPGGCLSADGRFEVGDFGLWWSATEYGSNDAYNQDIYWGSNMSSSNIWQAGRKSDLLSVRCIQD
jgi:uncharacterized protein (TIGR02145 family)